MSDKQIKAAVSEALQPYFSIQSIDFLAGGLSNRCLKISDVDGNDYVWRPNDHAVVQFGLNRHHEWQALTLAAQHNLTASPVVNLPSGLLTRWVEGEQLTSLSVQDVVRLLTRVHRLPALKNTCDLYERGMAYYSAIKAPDALLKKKHALCQRHQIVSVFPPRTIHCDLGYYNVIDHPYLGYQLIDWEYAGYGDPCLDLVFAHQVNDLPLDEIVTQYCDRNQNNNERTWMKQCHQWLPMTDYISAMWYALGYELYKDRMYWERALHYLNKI